MTKKKANYTLLNPGTDIRIENPLVNGIVDTTIIVLNVEADDVGDGSHTMNELYQHRYALFAALCKIYDNYVTPLQTRVKCWKSKLHSDGTMYPNWFIAGMTIQKVDGISYITYHLPMVWWNNFNVIEVEKAPEWDGHTSMDVIQRLGEL